MWTQTPLGTSVNGASSICSYSTAKNIKEITLISKGGKNKWKTGSPGTKEM